MQYGTVLDVSRIANSDQVLSPTKHGIEPDTHVLTTSDLTDDGCVRCYEAVLVPICGVYSSRRD